MKNSNKNQLKSYFKAYLQKFFMLVKKLKVPISQISLDILKWLLNSRASLWVAKNWGHESYAYNLSTTVSMTTLVVHSAGIYWWSIIFADSNFFSTIRIGIGCLFERQIKLVNLKSTFYHYFLQFSCFFQDGMFTFVS